MATTTTTRLECDHGFAWTDCAICYTAPGECGFGSCTDRASHVVTFDREGRRFCTRHATAPEYGFARAGSTSVERIAR